jgi:hypothetical protein
VAALLQSMTPTALTATAAATSGAMTLGRNAGRVLSQLMLVMQTGQPSVYRTCSLKSAWAGAAIR